MVKFVVSMLLGVMPMGGDVPKKIEREPMFAVVSECRNDTPKPTEIRLGKKKRGF
jgi:hypothetical protein